MRPTLIAFLLLSSVAPARATVLEVPLSGLLGTYTSADRMVAIHLPAKPSVIHGVSLRVRGTSTFASYSCDGSTQPVPVTIAADLFEDGDTFETVEGAYLEDSRDVPGAFDYVQTFALYSNPANWSFLLDDEARLRLVAWGLPSSSECNLVGPPDVTTFETVTLLIDGEFPTPTSATSWGSVKAIYR